MNKTCDLSVTRGYEARAQLLSLRSLRLPLLFYTYIPWLVSF
jgi:hypothetical protein